MRQTKKFTLSALIVALSVVVMALGALFELFDLSVCALASLFVAFVYIEIGSPYTFAVWLCTSLIVFLFFPGSFVWLEYLALFGIYPILKGYIERLSPKIWWPVKLLFGNAVILLLIFGFKLITGMPFFEAESKLIIAGLYLILNVAFAMYDIFLSVLIRFYLTRLRARFKRFLK